MFKATRTRALAALLLLAALPALAEAPPTIARNLSTPTLCAEEDNVNIPISGNVGAFVIEATFASSMKAAASRCSRS